jgi:hypothetical protein
MATWTQLVWQQAAVALLNGEQNLRTSHILYHNLLYIYHSLVNLFKNFLKHPIPLQT